MKQTARLLSCAVLMASLWGLTGASGQDPGGTYRHREPIVTTHPAELNNTVATTLGLNAGIVVPLTIRQSTGSTLAVDVPINGQLRTLTLVPHSIRSDRFEVRVQLADGSFVKVEPDDVRTYRGHVKGIAGSLVAASLLTDGLHASILLPNSETVWVEPLARRVANAQPNDHVVYRGRDVLPTGGTCGVDDRHKVLTAVSQENSAVTSASSVIQFTELAVDADVEYFNAFGTVAATVADIESIINDVNLIYERDSFISHVITTIIVRSAEPDPYVSNNALDLLCEFRDEWNGPQAGIPRDVTHLFTGKDLFSTTIGIAFLGTVCNVTTFSPDCQSNGNLAYGLSQSRFTTLLNNRVALTAHEIGHNWNASHCNGSTCHIMCPVIGGCGGVDGFNLRFSATSTTSISLFRNSRTCLGDELLNLTIRSGMNTVAENQPLQLTSEAQFLVGPNQDVTAQSTWSVSPLTVGVIDTRGLFTPGNVSGDSCATITASFSFSGRTQVDHMTIIVRDVDVPRAIVFSDPADGAIDARQPTTTNGTAVRGWDVISLTFNGDICLMNPGSLLIGEEGGNVPIPSIALFQPIGARSLLIQLSEGIEPGAWTTITEIDSGATIRLGFLPGDVDGNSVVSTTDDLLLLKNVLTSGGPLLPLYSTDLNRTGQATSADILRFLDLVNGAEAFDVWNGRTLPP